MKVTKTLFIALATLASASASANAQSWGDSQSEPLRESATTEFLHPARDAWDSSLNTDWELQPGATSGWMEKTWAIPKKVASVTVNVDLPQLASLRLSSLEGQSWIPIPGATLAGPHSGQWSVQVPGWITPTTKLLVTLDHGAGAKIWSVAADVSDASMGLTKVLPRTWTSTVPETANLSPRRLWDGVLANNWFTPMGFSNTPFEAYLTNSADMPSPAFPTYFGNPSTAGQVVWNLDTAYVVRVVKVYFLTARRKVTFQFWDGQNWVGDQVLSGGSAGWNRIALTASVKTDRVRLTFPDWNYANGIGEVEVWADGAASRTLLVKSPSQADGSIHFIAPSQSGDITLDVLVSGSPSGTLSGTWNGEAFTATGVVYGPETLFSTAIPSQWYKNRDAFLKVLPGSGNVVAAWFSDRRGRGVTRVPISVPAGTSYSRPLGQSLLLESIRVHATDSYAPTIQTQQGGVVTSQSFVAQGGGWWSSSIAGVAADTIVIASSNQAFLDVLEYSGTATADSQAAAEVVWPSSDPLKLVTSNGTDNSSIVGWAGTPDTVVTVNGVATRRADEAFWIPLKDLGLSPNQESTVTVTATKGGVSTSQTYSIRWVYAPGWSVGQNAAFLTTNETSFTVSGTVDSATKVFLNGSELSAPSGSFASTISLNPGYQRVRLQFWNSAHTVLKQSWDKPIFRSLGGPVIALDQPRGDFWTQGSTMLLRGRVGNSSGIGLTVNGAPVATDAGTFSVAVTLAEGNNTFAATATDSLGQTATQSWTIHRDSVAPAVQLVSPTGTTATPQPTVNLNLANPSGESVWWRLNQGPWEVLSGTSLSRLFVLDDGPHAFSVEVQDQAGNWVALPTAAVTVDGTPPLPFAIQGPANGWVTSATPTVTFMTTDSGSGVARYEASVDGGPWAATTSPWQVPSLAEGTHLLAVKAVDGAGNSQLAALQIAVDTIAPVAIDVTGVPTGWSSEPTPTLSFSSNDTGSGLAGWKGRIDNGSWQSVTSPWTLPQMADGQHVVEIAASDIAGNSTTNSASISIDATAPAAFAIQGLPDGWNSQSTWDVSFNTVDATSGIGTYQVSLNGGPWTPVNSPWHRTFADGAWEIRVQAVDLAGNVTESTTLLDVDTTSPSAVTGLVLVPGETQMLLSWDERSDSDADTTNWTVTRTPSWTVGPKAVVGHSFVDETELSADPYTYELTGVDRAGNSVTSPSVSGVLNLARATVVADLTTIVEHEEATVVVPSGALPEGTRSVVVTSAAVTEDAPAGEGNVVVSQVVSIAAVLGNGTPGEAIAGHTDLAEVVSVKLAYDPALIPADVDESGLTPFYYDDSWGRWIPLDNSSVDPIDHTVSFETNHFTDFSVQATPAAPISPQQTRDVQFSPFGTTTTHGSVVVSLKTGSVSTEFTELVLPGRAGLDLVLKRVYDTSVAQEDSTPDVDKTSAKPGDDGQAPWDLGVGWRLNFPYMRWSGLSLWVMGLDGQSLNFGQTKIMKTESIGNYRIVNLENHEGSDVRLELKFRRIVKPVIFLWVQIGTEDVYKLESAVLYHKDGRSVAFNKDGTVDSIQDLSGLNKVTFSYSSGHATRIVDSIGREVTFHYTSADRIDKIMVSDGASVGESSLPPIVYSYSGTKLIKAKDVGGRYYYYGYTTKKFSTSIHYSEPVSVSLPADPAVTGPNVPLLSSVSGPGVGNVTVTYESTDNQYTESHSGTRVYYVPDPAGGVPSRETAAYRYKTTVTRSRWVGESLVVDPDDMTSHSRKESYSFAFGRRDVFDPKSGTNREFYVSSATVVDGRAETQVAFTPILRDRHQLSEAPEALKDGLGFEVGQRVAPSEVVTLQTKSTKRMLGWDNDADTGNDYGEQVVQTWFDQDDENLGLKSQTVSHSSSNFSTISYTYDSWGNPKSIVEESQVGPALQSKKVTTRSYFNMGLSPTKLKLGVPDASTTESYAPLDAALKDHLKALVAAEKAVITSYLSEFQSGASDTESTEFTEYRYNKWGQPTTVRKLLSPSEGQTSAVWAESLLEYSNNGTTVSTGVAKNGELVNSADPEGHVTEYRYYYGETRAGHDSYRKTVTLKDVDLGGGETEDVTTEEAYNTLLGRPIWSKDARGFVTTRTFDALGRVTTLVEPDEDTNPLTLTQTTVVYDGDTEDLSSDPKAAMSITSKVVSPLGLETTFAFDKLGRLKQVAKLQRRGDSTETVTTNLTYNVWGEVATMAGPFSDTSENPGRTQDSRKTRYDYDWRGRVVTITAPDLDPSSPDNSISTDYDDPDNEETTTDEMLRTQTTVRAWNGQVLSVTQHPTSSSSVTTRTYYDGAGREIARIDGNFHAVLTEYDMQGKPVLTTEPAVEAWESGVSTVIAPTTQRTFDKVGNLVQTQQSLEGTNRYRTTTSTVNAIGKTLTTSSPVVVAGVPRTLVVSNSYDASGNLTGQATGYTGVKTTAKSWTYDSHGRVSSETDELNNVTSYGYDVEGHKTSVIDPQQSVYPTQNWTLQLIYDPLGRLVKAELPSLLTTQHPTILMTYDGAGNLFSRTEADGQKTEYVYNDRNLLVSSSVIAGAQTLVTGYQYDRSGREKTVKDPAGVTSGTSYDLAGRLTGENLGTPAERHYGYDGAGNRTTVTDGRTATASTTTITYDARNLPLTITDALSHTTTIRYDRWGQETWRQDSEKNIRKSSYDELGRLVSETDPFGGVSTRTWDAWGQVAARTDARGIGFVLDYSDNHHLLSEAATSTSGAGQSRSWAYDQGGAVKSSQDGSVSATFNTSSGTYQASPFGLVTSKTVNSLTMRYEYDSRQRLTKVTNPDDSTYDYTYNTMGTIDTLNGWVAGSLSYDTGGRLSGYTTSGTGAIARTFTYNTVGMLETLTNQSAAATPVPLKSYQFVYDAVGNLVDGKNASGVVEGHYDYDALSRLVYSSNSSYYPQDTTQIQPAYGLVDGDYVGQAVLTFGGDLTQASQVTLDTAHRSLGLDLNSVVGIKQIELTPATQMNRLKVSDISVFASSDNVTYTKVGAFTGTKGPDGHIRLNWEFAFSAQYLKVVTNWDDWDQNGAQVDAGEFKEQLGKLVKVWTYSDRNETLTYDGIGNRASSVIVGDPAGVKTNLYWQNADGGNTTRLKSDGYWSYTYDANGNRITKSHVSGDSWTYTWDLFNRLVEVSKNNTVVASYVYDADNLLVRRQAQGTTTSYAYGRNGALTYQATGGQTRSYVYLNDQIIGWTDNFSAATGSGTKLWAVTDQVGSVVQAVNASGAVVWSTGYTSFGQPTATDGSYAYDGSYAGHQVDPDTALIFMWNRWQDPETGRFLSEDPARDGDNWYAYAGNSPLVNTDPTGLIIGQIDDDYRGWSMGHGWQPGDRAWRGATLGDRTLTNGWSNLDTIGTKGCLVVAIARAINTAAGQRVTDPGQLADRMTFGPRYVNRNGDMDNDSITRAFKDKANLDVVVFDAGRGDGAFGNADRAVRALAKIRQTGFAVSDVYRNRDLREHYVNTEGTAGNGGILDVLGTSGKDVGVPYAVLGDASEPHQLFVKVVLPIDAMADFRRHYQAETWSDMRVQAAESGRALSTAEEQ